MKTYKIVVPAGIGDVSWLWSKLSTIDDAQFEIFSPNTYPQRTKVFCDTLAKAKGGLGNHSYRDIMVWGSNKGRDSWQETVNSFGEDEFIYIQANEHLGQGKRLEEWMPDLGVDFHYGFNFDFKEPYFTEEGPYMALHMASIKGIRAWKAWLPEMWYAFLQAIHKDFPDIRFVILGGTWDIDTASELIGLADGKLDLTDLTGKTTIKEAIRILDSVDYYIGYSSGLGVLSNVLWTPSTSLWPSHQSELIYSWPDPRMIESRDYMGFVYDAPERIYNRIKPKLREVFDGSKRRIGADSGFEKV